MASWSNQNQTKTFQQKYRVFSAAFWQKNGTPIDLEKSDKIVLPPSALSRLTECNASFPVLLKIQLIDSGTNKVLPSSVFSYVVDYSAPEGLVYMSSWMVTKLNLDQSGQSVVELNLPTPNNLKYQCPMADFLQLQPHSLQLMLLENVTNLVHAALSSYYSSLRVNDEITVYSKGKQHKLSVVKISGKDTSYSPKCVRLHPGNDNADNLMLGFSEPRNYELDNDDHKKQQNEDEIESDGEWEIVRVEKVQSIEDLEWKEPIKEMVNEEEDDDDVKVPNNKQAEILNSEPVDIEDQNEQKEEKKEEKKEENKEKKEEQKEAEIAEYAEWECPKCATINDIAYKFCPKCGCNKEQWQPPKNDQTKNKQNNLDEIVLQKVSVINDGHYSPNEQRPTGWIVRNISNKNINIKAKLVKLGGDKGVEVKYEEIIHFQMAANDEMFILIEVKAPSLPNQYHMFYQLVMIENEKKICDVLQLKVLVNKQFDDIKENKIKQILQMGFNDRNKIITALKKWNWDQLKAINWLATH